MHKTQPEPILRPIPSSLVNDEEQGFAGHAILNETLVADIRADGVRGVGDLVQGTGCGEFNEVGGGDGVIVGKGDGRHGCVDGSDIDNSEHSGGEYKSSVRLEEELSVLEPCSLILGNPL